MAATNGFDLIVFDCDGVLVDSEMLSCTCLCELLVQQGYDIDLVGVFARFLGRSFSVVEDQFQAELGRPLDAGFADALRQALRERFARGLLPMPGVESMLAGLARPFCVASSSDVDRLAHTLALTRLAPFFGDRVYSADLVERGKPAPDLFLYAARRLGARPARTLVLEDSVSGVRAGLAAGMIVWGFVGGSHYAENDGAALLTAAGAQRIVRSMADLSL